MIRIFTHLTFKVWMWNFVYEGIYLVANRITDSSLFLLRLVGVCSNLVMAKYITDPYNKFYFLE